MSALPLLPFRFGRYKDSILITNFVGDHLWVNEDEFFDIISFRIDPSSTLFHNLQSIFIISSGDVNFDIEMLSTRYRTKKAYLNDFTTLHMVVTTLRCNQSCKYCQASAKKSNEHDTDMSPETAHCVAEMIMKSPSPYIKVEFQGGEPTLNFEAIRIVTETIKDLNKESGKEIEFVLCTNLYNIADYVLDFCRHNKFCISTSIDGPASIHDQNRIGFAGQHTHKHVVAGIEKAAEYIGIDRIGALMTTTRANLGHFPEVVDEYVRLGLRYINFRTLNPYGRAITNYSDLNYTSNEFVESFFDGLQYIIELNKSGIYFVEGYTQLLLKRILTPFATGFVDLQSPSGFGISGAIYDYDGSIYGCDEGRMLAAMGDKKFRLGSTEDPYEDVFFGKTIKDVISNSIVESLPGCCDCVFRMWCGGDPVRHYATQKDLVGHKAFSEFCSKHMALFWELSTMLRDADSEVIDIFYSWINGHPISDKS